MVEVKFYDTVNDELLKFAVIISQSNGKWVFCKHKERDTYAFHTFADKPEVDYSQKEQKHPFTKAVLAPMKAVKKLLVSMELQLDASIDKLDNLAMNVQFDKEKRMEHTKDKDQKAPDTEREIIYSPMVAEPQEYKYNADAFEARKTSEAKQETAGKELPKVREDKAR